MTEYERFQEENSIIDPVRDERGERFIERENQMARDLASGKSKGDVYINGKPAPRESAKDTTIALMDKLAANLIS